MEQLALRMNGQPKRRTPAKAKEIGAGWRVLDLCCGVGGISLAAKQLGCEILGGVDVSLAAVASFRRNFRGAKTIVGSVTRKTTIAACAELLDNLNGTAKTLIVSGPPCQGFSAAGPRVKWDPRNRVLLAVARAIAKLQPTAALIENVATLLSKRHRSHLRRFKRVLSDAGFRVVILGLNAADFGVAQNRHRMVCLATKIALAESDVKRMLSELHAPTPTVRQALAGLRRPPVYKGPRIPMKPAVPNHIAMRHSPKVKRKIAAIAPGTGPMSYRRLHADKPSRTLISGNRAPPTHFSQARSITPREAARLQGFPDTFVVKDAFANQLLHVTNAVPPPLARAVISALIRSLEQIDGRD